MKFAKYSFKMASFQPKLIIKVGIKESFGRGSTFLKVGRQTPIHPRTCAPPHQTDPQTKCFGDQLYKF